MFSLCFGLVLKESSRILDRGAGYIRVSLVLHYGLYSAELTYNKKMQKPAESAGPAASAESAGYI